MTKKIEWRNIIHHPHTIASASNVPQGYKIFVSSLYTDIKNKTEELHGQRDIRLSMYLSIRSALQADIRKNSQT